MPHRILLIDDAKALHSLVRTLMTRDGHEFIAAYDAREGVKVARETAPDLILLDLDLPDVHGLDVCEMLIVQPETAQTPVIILSSTATTADRVRGLNAGACDYIGKPFDNEELCARVRAVLRHRSVLNMDRRAALRDGLTGLWNRSYLDDRLSTELASALRHERPLACVMLDIDRFKSVNDTHGHPVGDLVLQGVVGVMRKTCRREDVLCRYGGEEFVVLCPDTDAAKAARLAERLRANIAEHLIATPAGAMAVTASFGVSDVAISGEYLVRAADDALYAAKRAGRDRVCQADASAA